MKMYYKVYKELSYNERIELRIFTAEIVQT